jgi:hypothetical protein
MYSNTAIEALGPLFASHGWVFFAPYRRGQGLSATTGTYIGDEIATAVRKGGIPAGAATMIRLLETDPLNDQLAALAWLQKRLFDGWGWRAGKGFEETDWMGTIEVGVGREAAVFCEL